MKRIIINHWTAGTYKPNADDYLHYHNLIEQLPDGKARVQIGIHAIKDNDNCIDGNYAAHTGGCNTNCIGNSVCGMAGFDIVKKETKYPITKEQMEKLFELNAKQLFAEGWTKATKENLRTHYEQGQMVLSGEIKRTTLNAASIGKIDIMYLPCYPELKPNEVGDFIRHKTQVYLDRLLKKEE